MKEEKTKLEVLGFRKKMVMPRTDFFSEQFEVLNVKPRQLF